jgi:hypothetical protein
MKALDAYRDTLRELDKFESPTFSIGDFNYFYPQAVSRYVDENYKFFDVMQKEVDDLRSFITASSPLTLAGGVTTLPAQYRHILHLKVAMKFKVQIGKYALNQVVEFYPDRMKSGQKGFRFENAFTRPNHKRYYYEIIGDELRLIWNSTYADPNSGVNCWVDYIKEPNLIFLNPDKTSNYSLEANNSTLQFNTGSTRNSVYFEIIAKCRALFLENIESPRFPAAVQQVQSQ